MGEQLREGGAVVVAQFERGAEEAEQGGGEAVLEELGVGGEAQGIDSVLLEGCLQEVGLRVEQAADVFVLQGELALF